MFSVKYTPEQIKLKEELISTRKCLSDALDQYAALCFAIRRSHPPELFGPGETRKDALPWSDVLGELTSFPILETKMMEAKRDLTRVRDLGWANDTDSWLSTVTRPPIIRLPHEILIRVFQLVQATSPCILYSLDADRAAVCPMYPDYLAQVCAHWRNVALASPSLWTHIDLSSHSKYFGSLLGRALVHSGRAGQLPLRIHITGTEGLGGKTKVGVRWFMDTIIKRIQSLEVSQGFWHFGGLDTEAFGAILQGCSETFNRLVVQSKSPYRPAIFRPKKDRDHWETKNIMFPLPHKQIEQTFAQLTVLHASDVFPAWDSLAYRGLVDLRLTSDCEKGDAGIKERDLVAILNASPGLRIFHFGLQLKKVTHTDSPAPNIVLDDLEVLDIAAWSNTHPRDTLLEIANVLRLITPGSKSLRLTIRTDNYINLASLSIVKQFFLRSRVTKFCAKKGPPPPFELLSSASDLTDLVFDHCTYGLHLHQQRMEQNDIFDPVLRLDSWHIRGSSIYLDDLQSIARQYATRLLLLSNCRVYRRAGAPEEISGISIPLYKPGTRFTVHEGPLPDPTAGWNDLE